MTGEQAERMADLLVGQGKPAEGDVIAGGILDALEDALGAELKEQGV